MAIDSAEKRRSILGLMIRVPGIGVTPDSSRDQEWRQEVAGLYSGILVSAPSVVSAYMVSVVQHFVKSIGLDQRLQKNVAVKQNIVDEVLIDQRLPAERT